MKNRFIGFFNQHKLFFSIIFLSLTICLNFISSTLIHRYFPDRLPAEDLLFRLTPYSPDAQYFTDFLNILSIILLITYLFRSNLKKTSYVFFCFGLMELLRGILIILTPLGSVLGNDIEFGITSIKQYGAFPSGHVALAILIYFLIDAKESSKIKSAALVLAIFEIICQILARGHYSIDIVGGFFIAYFTYNELSKFENQLTLD